MEKADRAIIDFMRRVHTPFARFAIFVIFFWFGILKVFSLSPASPMVLELLGETMSFLDPESFLVAFGLFESAIGMSFLIPRLERAAIALLMIHLVTTVMPLALLPALTWQSAFIPTMEGQYIIKNILIIALAMGIAANLRPIRT